MTFSAPIDLTAKYDVTILSSSIISLVLRSGERWDAWGNMPTFRLTSISVGGISKWGESESYQQGEAYHPTWQIFRTPTVQRGDDRIIYMSTSSFAIEGTGFMTWEGTDSDTRAMTAGLTKLVFDPPLVRDVDYVVGSGIYAVPDCEKQGACLQLTLIRGKNWRSDLKPGPLKLTHLDTGGGTLRIDAENGGVTVAEVRANALAGPNLLVDRVSSISALEQNGEILPFLNHYANPNCGTCAPALYYGRIAFPDFKVFVLTIESESSLLKSRCLLLWKLYRPTFFPASATTPRSSSRRQTSETEPPSPRKSSTGFGQKPFFVWLDVRFRKEKAAAIPASSRSVWAITWAIPMFRWPFRVCRVSR